jgi:class 3 adenylate cyclase/tetratricopeptide (TPR) repeat protein
MSSSRIERKLAAIMFTDIAGYTAQMSKDEAVAISLLNKQESILKPLILEHNGTYVKSTGDGSLSHFNSAVDAATCAKRFQESIYDDKDLNVRVGVHLGDTIFEKGDIRGDGVNIASRLESMAIAGGVFVSKEVHDQLTNQKEFEGVSLGLQSMKGVGRLIEVYGLKGDKLSEPKPSEYQDNKVVVHSDDEVPSIAIIPLKNKGDDKDIFYAYGISADLISDCSGAGLIRVESLDNIEKVENHDKLSAQELASKLFVRYIATGTLWKMDNMFQLSIELYDTKESKVVWSDRWQENWDNLVAIKGKLSDGILKALDTKPKVEQKVETTNAEAYEFYLKAHLKYAKRENTDDTEIARGLLNKAIELDDNLIVAKDLLGWTYSTTGDYDKAMEIYTSALKQAEEVGDKGGMGRSLLSIGVVYSDKGDFGTALDYYNRSLAIREEVGDKRGMGYSLNNIGIVYGNKGDLDTALDYHSRSLAIKEEIGDKSGMGVALNNIGLGCLDKGDYDKALDYYDRSLAIAEELCNKRGMGATLTGIGIVHYFKGDLDTALDYSERSLAIAEELGDKRGMVRSLHSIGHMHWNKGDYEKALEYLEKSLSIQKEIGLGEGSLMLATTTFLYLTYKNLGKQYDVKEIHTLIKETENIEFGLNLRLYELLENKSFLKTAYNQVQEKASAMDDGAKFLSYPIPKAIVEEWEKVK